MKTLLALAVAFAMGTVVVSTAVAQSSDEETITTATEATTEQAEPVSIEPCCPENCVCVIRDNTCIPVVCY